MQHSHTYFIVSPFIWARGTSGCQFTLFENRKGRGLVEPHGKYKEVEVARTVILLEVNICNLFYYAVEWEVNSTTKSNTAVGYCSVYISVKTLNKVVGRCDNDCNKWL